MYIKLKGFLYNKVIAFTHQINITHRFSIWNISTMSTINYHYRIPDEFNEPHPMSTRKVHRILSNDELYYHVNVNPQCVFIHRRCYADSDCMEEIGQKANDMGTLKTLFYTKDYNVFAKSSDPGMVIRVSSDKVWVKITKEHFKSRDPNDIYW